MRMCAVKQPIRRTVWLALLMGVAAIWLHGSSAAIAADDEATLARVSGDVRVLSADEMEGRGPGTAGLQKAGDYVRDEFRRLGLKSGPADGSYRQPFEVPIGSRTVAASTSLTLRGSDGQAWKLELGRDFQAFAAAAPLQAVPETKLTSVAAVEKHIDDVFQPASQPMQGWSAEVECTFEKALAETANIVGVLEGAGPLAQETIVLGAHYDHIGRGEFGSRKPDAGEVHNGADDNATGTAAVLELARRMRGRGPAPARRLVFVAFSGEERGLVGSKFYVDHPLFPLADTVAMLNFDMVGRLRNDELTVFGTRSAKEFDGFLDRVGGEAGLKLKKDDRTLAMGDHFAFYQRGIPALHFFTGLTNEYHTPDDDFVTINVPGVVRTVDFAEDVLDLVVTLPGRPQFVKGAASGPGASGMAYLGITLDQAAGSDGPEISAVAANSPAAQGGLQPGDVILQFGDSAVADLRADGRLAKTKARRYRQHPGAPPAAVGHLYGDPGTAPGRLSDAGCGVREMGADGWSGVNFCGPGSRLWRARVGRDN